MTMFARAHESQRDYMDFGSAERAGLALVHTLYRAARAAVRPPGHAYGSHEELVLMLAGARVILEPTDELHPWMTHAPELGSPEVFRIAVSLAARDNSLFYVEGFAHMNNGSDRDGNPVHHAWAIRRDGLLIDPCMGAWSIYAPVAYLGLPFTVPFATERLAQAGSVFGAEPSLLAKGPRQDARGIIWGVAE